MKKASKSFAEGKYENSEISRRLYRGVADAAHKLEERMHSATSPKDLLGPEVTELRGRLKEYCERLMFAAPLDYGRKAEELMWRKVYYELLQQCKMHRKKATCDLTSPPGGFSDGAWLGLLQGHLLAGLGHYHHLLLRLQAEFRLHLEGRLDLPYLWKNPGLPRERTRKRQQELGQLEEEVQVWAWQTCQRFLICLGDLARYLSEVDDSENNGEWKQHWASLSRRSYQQAHGLAPRLGMPHNQLGTLHSAKHHGCDSAYYYLRCLHSEQPFEGAEGNLLQLFDRNSHALVEAANTEKQQQDDSKNNKLFSFATRFLKVCEHFYLSIEDNIQILCEDTLQHFSLLLDETDKEVISADLVFMVVITALMCTEKIKQAANTSLTNAAVAFALSLHSYVVETCSKRLATSLGLSSNNNADTELGRSDLLTTTVKLPEEIPIICEKTHKGKPSRLRNCRRRRRVRHTSLGDTEGSDDESDVNEEDISESDTDSERDVETAPIATSLVTNGPSSELRGLPNLLPKTVGSLPNGIVVSSSHDTMSSGTAETDEGGVDNSGRASDILQELSQEGLLCTVKAVCDWLRTHPELIASCAQAQSLSRHTVALLNILLAARTDVLAGDGKLSEQCHRLSKGDSCKSLPLPEDIVLQGLPFFSKAHQGLIFTSLEKLMEITPALQAFQRMQCLLQYGSFVAARAKSGITYVAEEDRFEVHGPAHTNGTASPASSDGSAENQQRKQQVMRSMAHLWLEQEVRELQEGVSASPPPLPPYLVPDSSVLCHHLTLLRRLVATRRFVLLLPAHVISSLDQLKRESIGARESIRWLEMELRRGSRYIRSQKPHEKVSLSPIKYPKRKEKDAWDFFQILECCKYLEQQSPRGGPSKTMVTLLTGGPYQRPGNASVLAQSAGINTEDIEEFISKWQTSSKSQG
ncbi:nonsense-mediated mRNA decay factor SMG5-like [Ornithodoros turicata]|uniref:nonsense-mediated mRNA decay factor SMG5-like n=1 Tax=Ornithodoros turicata TaxID=34597 RepID=UPI0031397953